MRVLTEKEKELLVGGVITLDQVTVHADRFDMEIGYSMDMWNDPFNWDADEGYSGNSGGSSSPECESSDPADVERYVDSLASKLARDIIAKPYDQTREYLGLIYRDEEGTLKASQIWGGTDSVSVNFEDLGFPASQIVGIVHNHDKGHYGQSSVSAQVNRHPSAGDWDTADALVAYGVNSSTLALYLLDTANVFRQYDYTDKSKYISNGYVAPNAQLGQAASKTLTPSYCPP